MVEIVSVPFFNELEGSTTQKAPNARILGTHNFYGSAKKEEQPFID